MTARLPSLICDLCFLINHWYFLARDLSIVWRVFLTLFTTKIVGVNFSVGGLSCTANSAVTTVEIIFFKNQISNESMLNIIVSPIFHYRKEFYYVHTHVHYEPIINLCCKFFPTICCLLSREEGAIRDLLTVTKDTRTGGPAEGAHLHIVHLSDSRSSLDLIMVIYSSSCVQIWCNIDL